MSKHHHIPASHFSKKTLKGLTSKGIAIVSMTYIPGPGGDYTNGFTGYMLDDNGTGRVRSYLEVEAMAKGNQPMRTYKICCDEKAYLSLPSNASITDHETIDQGYHVFVEVTGNYTRFEHQLDAIEGILSYDVVEDDE